MRRAREEGLCDFQLRHLLLARRLAPEALSERQLSILGLMAKGLTNAQISKRVGFSESTVRQETMAIYRFFGVGGRREAVRLAGMRGLLEATAT